MKTKVFIIPLIVIIILVIAFYAFNDYIYQEKQEDVTKEAPIVAENPEGEADPARMTLDMTKWNWIKAHYNDGREILPKKEKIFTLTFNKEGRFSATTDCNSMSGEYKAQQGAINFENIASTEMYCEGSQESEFAELLTNTTNYHFTSRGELILNLKFDSGSVVFR